MRVLLLVVLLALPSSLFATPIEQLSTVTFEQALTMDLYIENPPATLNPDWHTFPTISANWDVPVFNPALGIVEGLVLIWYPIIDVVVTTDPPGSAPAP